MSEILGLCPVTTNKRITLPDKVIKQLRIKERESKILISEIDGKIILTNAEA